MEKVLLINPRNYIAVPYPDLGLAYLSTAIKSENVKVDFLDFITEKIPLLKLIELLKKKPDIIGIKLYSEYLMNLPAIFDLKRKFTPDSLVLVGGPHPSAEPEKMLEMFPDIDFAVFSEGEIPIKKLIQHLKANNTDYSDIPNLVWRKEDKIIKNMQYLHHNIEDYGFPDWSIYPYIPFDYNRGMPSTKQILIMATRGCPFHCAYCSGGQITGYKIRKRSFDHVISEMKYMINKYGIEHFIFTDENLTLLRSYAMELAQRIIDEKLNITWSIPFGISINYIDKEYFQLLEKSGLVYVSIAYESGSQRILDLMNKPNRVSTYIEKTNIIKKYTNIFIGGFFIFGYPDEKISDLKKTIYLIKHLPIDAISLFFFQLLPGSPVYYQYKHKLKENLFYKIDYEHIPLNFSQIKTWKLKFYQIYAYIVFNFKSRILKHIISYMFKNNLFFTMIKRIFYYLFGITTKFEYLNLNSNINKKLLKKMGFYEQ